MSSTKTIGEKAEEAVSKWLIQKGFDILERNWRHKHWEIDIIVSKDNKLHFIEVKSRSSVKYGYPEAAINPSKMLALKNGIEEYLNEHPEWQTIQIDVLTVIWKLGKIQEILMIEDVY